MSETPFFSCEGLSLDLGGREVLSNIGLELHQGEVLGTSTICPFSSARDLASGALIKRRSCPKNSRWARP